MPGIKRTLGYSRRGSDLLHRNNIIAIAQKHSPRDLDDMFIDRLCPGCAGPSPARFEKLLFLGCHLSLVAKLYARGNGMRE
jgi:hypothetical protein